MLNEKLGKIQKTLKATKSQFNNFGKYSYRSCEDILEAVKPLLSEEGCTIIISDEMVMLGDRFYVKATATFRQGESIDQTGGVSATAYAREPLAQKGMNEAQITGSVSSYARKYALNGLLLIDDNKDADSQKPPEKEQISPEPINQEKVNNAAVFFKARIDEDSPEGTHQLIKDHFKKLSNDEKIAVSELMKDKAPDSNKMYKNLLKDHLNFKLGE